MPVLSEQWKSLHLSSYLPTMKTLQVFLGILLLNHHTTLGHGDGSRAQVSRSQPNGSHALVIPQRINEAGDPYPDGQHFIKYTSSADASDRQTARLHYRLTAFGQVFEFHLYLDHSFISPSLTVEHVFSENHRIPFAGDLQHCFYRGHINRDPVSSAVLNVCNGLRGVFSTGDEKYFIEPTEPRRARHLDQDDSRKFHLVYRHSASEDRVRNGTLMCGLKETSRRSPRGASPVVKHGRPRRKRALDEAFVETMVTADKTMSDAFKSKADLQSYIITLMGMVAQMFRDSSIGNRVNIVLVKIIILEYEEPDLKVTSSASRNLKRFCKWQHKRNEQNDSHPDHYDTSILLTRTDICRSPGKCDTLGLAELGTMCNPTRSCSIAEDTGLNTGFTISHELGHIFSVPHDGDRNKCNRRSGKQRLMSPSLSFQAKPWGWSECSKDYITKFLDQGSGDCLSDPPVESRVAIWQESLPGELYSADRQCQFLFGKSSHICERMEECSRLWCARIIGKRKACSTHHMPWSDGTPCGEDKQNWCIRGKCVKKEKQASVDGNWGEWLPFGECTRTCGGGVAFAERECDNPIPSNGGLYCRGKQKRFKSCNTQACSEAGLDFRYFQCRKLDEKVVRIKGVANKLNWIPLYKVDKTKQCKLTCRAVGKPYYFTLDNVIDGTPCNEDTTDICVDGRCLPAGCDRKLGSTARLDTCGVCKGDNSTCVKSVGTLVKRVSFGYNHILTIPMGSTDIKISQVSSNNKADDNFLALKVQGGKYLLNGAMLVMYGVRKFHVSGVKMWYSGSNVPHEEIRMTGKTTNTLKVYVLSIGSLISPSVGYSFLEPVKKRKSYVWGKTGKWTECTLLCHGKRKREVQCMRANDEQPVPDHRCDQRNKPFSVVEDCNTSCDLRWQVVPMEECSARCGPGKQRLVVRCTKEDRHQVKHMLEQHCKHLKKPLSLVECEGMCANSQWSYSEWTECSKSCGSGTQTRNATCYDNRGDLLKDRDCRASDLEPISRQCNTLKCPGWSTSVWTQCPVSCGVGEQARTVKCETTDSIEVPEDLCDAQTKPTDVKLCVLDDCPAVWQLGNWSECSVSCGAGRRTRQIQCVAEGYGGEELTPERCDSGSRPSEAEDCIMPDCIEANKAVQDHSATRTEWKSGEWSECSVSCGVGIETRVVNCLNEKGNQLKDEQCNRTTKPASVQECLQGSCTSWKYGAWGVCSRPCGSGYRTRVVKCAYDSWEITDDSNCDHQEKPAARISCQIKPCKSSERVSVSMTAPADALTTTKRPTTVQLPQWTAGKWSKCSVTCGVGRKERRVQCDGVGCDEGTKPTNTDQCEQEACPQWRTGPWTECSATCGKGVKERTVECDGERCEEETKPTESAVCTGRKCPEWKAGPWSECSVSCGRGTKEREVDCVGVCDEKTKPLVTAICNQQPCPEWRAGPWSECSVTCGQGVKTRRVVCEGEKCDEKTKPVKAAPCEKDDCPKWTTGAWSECSVTCGKGIKERSVECDGANCDEIIKPPAIDECQEKACPKWTAEAWGECTVTCGRGIRGRKVECDGVGCDEKTKPLATTLCNEGVCPQWRTGPWNKCTVTCGRGIRGRKVECDGVGCDEKTKPLATTLCNEGVCPKWRLGPWSECSKTCGKGEMKREVNCSLNNGHKLDDTACEGQDKPQEIQACKKPDCVIGAEWKKGIWMKCSVYCGEGAKHRDIWCEAQGTKVDDTHCGYLHKPRTTRSCNKRRRCGNWEMGPWSKCSRSCGGVQSRAIRCLNADEYKVPLLRYCDPMTQPVHERPCNMVSCDQVISKYQWQTAPWSKCSKQCGYGRKSRLMRCIDRFGNPVSEDRCDEKTKPAKFFRCFNMQCPPEWKHGDWSECSRTCGLGYQYRQVECRGEPAGNTSVNAGCNRTNKPPVWRSCNMGNCGGERVWKTRPWSQCSHSCGTGYMRRAVNCLTKYGQFVGDNECTSPASPRPEDTRFCHMKPCVPRSCKDLQRTNSLYDDGEHVLQVQGKSLQVYCYGMMTPTPREYITLKAGSAHNFAEVYSKRLSDPYTCPMNGSHSDTCNCDGKDYDKAGASYFSRLRIDLNELKIIVEDRQFAETTGTIPPSYASAGDCYSARQCPQGRFGINLAGTGLSLSPSVKWRSSGHSYSKVIYRYPEGQVVVGKCGGRCGMCRPDSEIGLKVVLFEER